MHFLYEIAKIMSKAMGKGKCQVFILTENVVADKRL
jgi:hypothetical protein